jgi:hypothetical protein
MTCSEQTRELVEYARRGMEPDGALRSHLAACGACRERWEIERQLTFRFERMRAAAQTRGADVARRRNLMQEFARRRERYHSRREVKAWSWTLAAAVGVILAVIGGHEWGVRTQPTPVPAVRTHGVRNTESVLYEVSNDASALSGEDFVAVPYAPPLAPGELIRVLRTNLYPQALASLGIDVDPSGDNFAAEVVVGEDGLPRAVRIAEGSDF